MAIKNGVDTMSDKDTISKTLSAISPKSRWYMTKSIKPDIQNNGN